MNFVVKLLFFGASRASFFNYPHTYPAYRSKWKIFLAALILFFTLVAGVFIFFVLFYLLSDNRSYVTTDLQTTGYAVWDGSDPYECVCSGINITTLIQKMNVDLLLGPIHNHTLKNELDYVEQEFLKPLPILCGKTAKQRAAWGLSIPIFTTLLYWELYRAHRGVDFGIFMSRQQLYVELRVHYAGAIWDSVFNLQTTWMLGSLQAEFRQLVDTIDTIDKNTTITPTDEAVDYNTVIDEARQYSIFTLIRDLIILPYDQFVESWPCALTQQSNVSWPGWNSARNSFYVQELADKIAMQIVSRVQVDDYIRACGSSICTKVVSRSLLECISLSLPLATVAYGILLLIFKLALKTFHVLPRKNPAVALEDDGEEEDEERAICKSEPCRRNVPGDSHLMSTACSENAIMGEGVASPSMPVPTTPLSQQKQKRPNNKQKICNSSCGYSGYSDCSSDIGGFGPNGDDPAGDPVHPPTKSTNGQREIPRPVVLPPTRASVVSVTPSEVKPPAPKKPRVLHPSPNFG